MHKHYLYKILLLLLLLLEINGVIILKSHEFEDCWSVIGAL